MVMQIRTRTRSCLLCVDINWIWVSTQHTRARLLRMADAKTTTPDPGCPIKMSKFSYIEYLFSNTMFTTVFHLRAIHRSRSNIHSSWLLIVINFLLKFQTSRLQRFSRKSSVKMFPQMKRASSIWCSGAGPSSAVGVAVVEHLLLIWGASFGKLSRLYKIILLTSTCAV